MMLRWRDHAIATALFVKVVSAQDPLWQASVPSVQQHGLYSIALSPELIGRSRPDLGDLRLVDSTGQEVPYVVRTTRTGLSTTDFVPYTLLRNEVRTGRTVIELERPAERVLDVLHVWIRPVDVEKHIRILGSDDRKQWYMVKDEEVALQGAYGDPPHQVLTLRIPPSDYRYFQILLNDSLTPPMRVIGVGHFTNEQTWPRYTQSAPLDWTRSDSLQETHIHVRSAHPIPLDRIRYAVSDTVPFRRTGYLRTKRTSAIREGRLERTSKVERTVATFIIGSDLVHVIDLLGVRADTFDLVIDNGDDRPLDFIEVHAFATEQLLLAHLTPGMSYRLRTGNGSLTAPRYDMAHFVDDLPGPAGTLTHGTLQPLLPQAPDPPRFDPAKWWVWALIFALMGGMGYLAIRMLRSEG